MPLALDSTLFAGDAGTTEGLSHYVSCDRQECRHANRRTPYAKLSKQFRFGMAELEAFSKQPASSIGKRLDQRTHFEIEQEFRVVAVKDVFEVFRKINIII